MKRVTYKCDLCGEQLDLDDKCTGRCSDIEKQHPEVFKWVQDVLRYQIQKAIDEHKTGFKHEGEDRWD